MAFLKLNSCSSAECIQLILRAFLDKVLLNPGITKFAKKAVLAKPGVLLCILSLFEWDGTQEVCQSCYLEIVTFLCKLKNLIEHHWQLFLPIRCMCI